MLNSVYPDETAHLDLRCLQKPIMIAYGSERVNKLTFSDLEAHISRNFCRPCHVKGHLPGIGGKKCSDELSNLHNLNRASQSVYRLVGYCKIHQWTAEEPIEPRISAITVFGYVIIIVIIIVRMCLESIFPHDIDHKQFALSATEPHHEKRYFWAICEQ